MTLNHFFFLFFLRIYPYLYYNNNYNYNDNNINDMIEFNTLKDIAISNYINKNLKETIETT